MKRDCLIFRIVDLVKAVNAWVRSAFDKVDMYFITHLYLYKYPYKYLEICRYHVCLVVSYDSTSGKAHRSK